jgi:Matrixin
MWLGLGLGCESEDVGSYAQVMIESEEPVIDDLRAPPVVEVLDGVSVNVPPPGMRVSVEVVYDDGQVVLADVWTDEDGRVDLHIHDAEWGLVAPPSPVAVCPNKCADNRSSLLGAHWAGSLTWRYRDVGRPVALSKVSVINAFTDGASAVTTARDACGLPDNVSATQSYLGETGVAPAISLAGGVISCGASDATNVLGWADLPANTLGVTCLWWYANGEAAGTDMLYDNIYTWFAGTSVPAGCANQWSLRAVALHEFGHANGLGHSPGDSCNLVMYPFLDGCAVDKRYLGLGDVQALEALY